MIQEAVSKIQKLGIPPKGFEDVKFPGDNEFPSDETLDLWEEYETAVVSIHTPVTWEEAEILIKCCPVDHMAGIEWSLLHCIESCLENGWLESPEEIARYKKLILECNSDMMKDLLLSRLDATISIHP